MKRCPYCAKEIQDDAIKCRYCGRFLKENKILKIKGHLNKKLNTSQINRILIIITLFILVFILFYLLKLNSYKSNSNLNIGNQEKLLKSIVKIEYTDNEDNDWIGSGIMFTKDGLLLTNNHVIEDEKTGTSAGGIKVCVLEDIGLQPDCSYLGDLVIRNPLLDLAIIKIRNFNATNYINLFEGDNINTSMFGKTINIYGYPTLGGNKITITKGIFSGFDDENNIKTDAEINGGNSGGGAFFLNDFIGIPTSVMHEDDGKIGYIISKNKILSWFYSITKNKFNIENIKSNFNNTNLIYKGNNISDNSTFDTPYYEEYIKEMMELYKVYNDGCIETFGINSYFTLEFNDDGIYICNCKIGYEWGGKNNEECVNSITDEELGNEVCIENFGINSYFTGKFNEDGQYLCLCDEGYEWGGYNDKECVKLISDYERRTKICQDTYGIGGYFTGEIEDGKIMCNCKIGYEWGINYDICIYSNDKIYSNEIKLY